MTAPDGLGEAGLAVWNGIHDDLGDEFELDARELVILEAAARQADTNRQLEDAIAASGLIVEGSQGQARLNAAVTELRQGRVALEKLLASLALPNEDGKTLTAAQKRARSAAEARWGVRRGAA
jgi:hypothetical protein